MDALIQAAARQLASAKKVVISTGAGVSKESGVPTFRDAQEGLWAKYNPEELATPEGFRKNPRLVWDWYMYRRQMVEKTEPNPGHYALAELEDLLPEVILVTQNVDNLHQRAGSSTIIPLHGNLFAYKCAADCQGTPTPVDLNGLQWDDTPPLCPHCQQAYVRPDVVWFHEVLPADNLARAIAESESCDVMMVIGTSGMVYPAAWLPIRAKLKNAFLIEVNPNPSELTPRMDVYLPAPSGQVMPRVVAALRQELSGK